MAKSTAKMEVKTLQVLIFRPQVPESVLHPRVEIHFHGLHHLPWCEARCHQRRCVLLQRLELGCEFNSATHVIKTIADPQIRVRLHVRHRRDRRVVERKLEVVSLNSTTTVASHTHTATLGRVGCHARPSQKLCNESMLLRDARLGAAEYLEVVGISRYTKAVITRELHTRFL